MRMYTERHSDNFRRSQDESQSDGKIICLKSYVPMSSKTQIQQRGKIQPLKTVELSEYQKFIIKFTCTDPRIVNAKKDVVEIFTLQFLITLFS